MKRERDALRRRCEALERAGNLLHGYLTHDGVNTGKERDAIRVWDAVVRGGDAG